MSKKGKPRAASDAQTVKLPEAVAQIAREHPDLWAAFQRLGEEASQAGPLDARTRRLIHIAYAIAAGSEGATHSHARRAVAEGLDQAELDHVALLAITSDGVVASDQGSDLGARRHARQAHVIRSARRAWALPAVLRQPPAVRAGGSAQTMTQPAPRSSPTSVPGVKATGEGSSRPVRTSEAKRPSCGRWPTSIKIGRAHV